MVMRGAKRARRYYGPFAHAYAIRETLDLLLRTFPIRTCTQAVRSPPPSRTAVLCAHIEKRGAVRRGRATRGVRPAGRRPARVPRRRSLARPRSPRQANARRRRLARVRERRSLRDQIASVRKVIERQQMVGPKEEDFDLHRARRRCTEASWYRCSSCRVGWSVARASWSTRSRTSSLLLRRSHSRAALRRRPGDGRAREVLVPSFPTTPSCMSSS